MATTRRKRRVELYKSIFLFTFFIYNIYFLWEKTSAWGHSNPVTYVLKTEGDYRYGFGCSLTKLSLVNAGGFSRCRVWNLTTGETVAGPFTGHMEAVRSVAFSPDGQRIVSGSKDRTIRLWNVTTGERVASSFIGHKDSVESVAFSPDGQCIVSSGRGPIRML